MKKFNALCTVLSSLGLISTSTSLMAATTNGTETVKQVKVGVVDFKQCIEISKLGKQEQVNFENLKKQMENVLEEKEKSLNDLATKLNDPDYLDSLTPEAETELKRKFRALNQELTQQQGQYYQALNQANIKIVQKIQDTIAKASEKVAKDDSIDMILNDEGTFYFSPALDITTKVVAAMDEMFEADQKNAPKTPAPSTNGMAQPVKQTPTAK